FLNDIQTFLTVAAATSHNFLITGDFNIHVNKLTNSYKTQFYSILGAFNLTQLVSVPTHKDHNTLDLVIIPADSDLVTDLSVLPVSPSDHFPILSYLKLVNIPRTPVTRFKRHINTINIDAFLCDLADGPLILHPPTTLDELVQA